MTEIFERAVEASHAACPEIPVETHRVLVRAAIEAITAPTQRMIYAADGFTDLVYPFLCDTAEESSKARHEEFNTAWRVMIDVILGKPL